MIYDEDLGNIVLVPNARARRLIARVRSGSLYLTHPRHISEQQIRQGIDEMRPKLLDLLKRTETSSNLNPNLVLETSSFRVKIVESNLSSLYHNLREGQLNISCPSGFDYSCVNNQARLRQLIELYMRREAKRIFLPKTNEIAEQHGLSYNTLSINKSRGRWGSCSSKKNINLSYFCLFLPEHLINFVILHELCHTVEMNHSHRFWALLDKLSNTKSKRYTEELRKTKLPW